jgi:hypothetical protein
VNDSDEQKDLRQRQERCEDRNHDG